jgi:prefoldin alpha subunit
MKDVKVPARRPEALQRDVQEKLIIYQLLQQQAENLKQAAVLLEKSAAEVMMSKDVMADLKTVKSEADTFLPIGSGCYVKGKVMQTDVVLAEVGAGVLREKSPAEAGKILDARLDEIKKQESAIQADLGMIADKMKELLPELQKIAREAQGQ